MLVPMIMPASCSHPPVEESSCSSSAYSGTKKPGRPRKRPLESSVVPYEFPPGFPETGMPCPKQPRQQQWPQQQQQLHHVVAFEPPPQSCCGGAAELRAAAAHTITAASAVGVWAATAKNAAESLAMAIRHTTTLPGEEDVKHAAAACERLAKVLSAASEAGLELSAQADKAMHRAIRLELADHGTGSASLATQLRSLATALDSSNSAHFQPQKPNTQNRGRGKAAPTKDAAESQAGSSRQREVQQPKLPTQSRRSALTLPVPVAFEAPGLDEQPCKKVRKQWRFLPRAACKPKANVGKSVSKKMNGPGCVKAERLASEILERGDRIRDKDVVDILEMWRFRKNHKRRNVLPEGHPFVYSEMLGLTKIRTYNRFVVAANTRKFPLVTKLLCKFLDDNPPTGMEFGTRFPFTTVCINKDYAAKRHRDNNNVGMTVLRGLGNYRGGRVKHWPQDPGRHQFPDVDDLAEEEALILDTRHRSVCIDSTKAHEVMEFSGKRFSLVYFTITRFEKTPEDVRDFLRDMCDLSIPDPEIAQDLWQVARESAPGAAGVVPSPASDAVIAVEEDVEEEEDAEDEQEEEPERPRSKIWASKSIVVD